mmetsp:Transcript_42459/g.133127  ORF Transcript_42459/g.133127 Transcript_42459/m.133127 type:complete len:86 (+) Transcript_42459:1237-1494(+)
MDRIRRIRAEEHVFWASVNGAKEGGDGNPLSPSDASRAPTFFPASDEARGDAQPAQIPMPPSPSSRMAPCTSTDGTRASLLKILR